MVTSFQIEKLLTFLNILILILILIWYWFKWKYAQAKNLIREKIYFEIVFTCSMYVLNSMPKHALRKKYPRKLNLKKYFKEYQLDSDLSGWIVEMTNSTNKIWFILFKYRYYVSWFHYILWFSNVFWIFIYNFLFCFIFYKKAKQETLQTLTPRVKI